MSTNNANGNSPNPNVFWQEAKKEEFPFDLHFDIKDVANVFPKLTLERDEILRILPRKLDSQIYNLKFDGLVTSWRIFLKLKDKKDEDLGLGVYLELLDQRECLDDSPNRSGRHSATKKTEHVCGKFSVTLVNSLDTPVLTFDAGFHKFDKHEPDWGFAKLFTLEDFWAKKNVYYPDGTLRLRIPLKVLGSLSYRGTQPPQHVTEKRLPAHTLKFMDDVLDLFTSGRESDLKIICGGTIFKVHRSVLSARSPVFRRMLETRMTESQTGNIQITDIEPEAMKILLTYIYSSRNPIVELEYEELVGLVKASDKYELDELKHLCFPALIRDHLNLINCGELAVLAYLHQADKPQRDEIYEYCHGHWSTLTRESAFKSLVQSYPGAFFVPENK